MHNAEHKPQTPARTVGHFLSDNARYLARTCSPEDQAAATAFARILRQRPEDVLALATKLTRARRGRPRKSVPVNAPADPRKAG